MVLQIENLTFGFDNNLLYKDFSLNLKKGEVVSIVGPSGSGKSTLFDLITGELKPHTGAIKTKKIAQIFQDPYTSFHPTYSIIDQIKEVASLHDMDMYLKTLNVKKELLHKKPHKLSGGELQRCSILRSLLQKPDLILADEPTSALDNVTALSVMKLLVKFLDKVAIVLITHDNDLASWCSDRIIKLPVS